MKEINVENMVVVKRDGTVVGFDIETIVTAIHNASVESGEHLDAEGLAEKVVKRLKGDSVSVEAIQDEVVHVLMVSKFKITAQVYIRYRTERDQARSMKSDLYTALSGFLEGTDDSHAKANANKDPDQIVTHRDLIAGIVSKEVAKVILPKDVMLAHEKGLIRVHDMDYIISKGIHNCGVYDFEYMLANGVKLGDVEIETPKSVGTAANVMCQILSKISGSSLGGQSVHEFDKVLKPYVEKSLSKIRAIQTKYNLPEDYVTETIEKEVFSACQTFIYQIQTVTGNNGQSSFGTISLSLSTDSICKLIKEQYLKCHMQGIGPKHTTPIFPKVLYFVEEGVNLYKGDVNYEELQLALKCSSLHMYPDLIMAPNNRKMSGGSKNVVTAMGKL